MVADEYKLKRDWIPILSVTIPVLVVVIGFAIRVEIQLATLSEQMKNTVPRSDLIEASTDLKLAKKDLTNLEKTLGQYHTKVDEFVGVKHIEHEKGLQGSMKEMETEIHEQLKTHRLRVDSLDKSLKDLLTALSGVGMN